MLLRPEATAEGEVARWMYCWRRMAWSAGPLRVSVWRPRRRRTAPALCVFVGVAGAAGAGGCACGCCGRGEGLCDRGVAAGAGTRWRQRASQPCSGRCIGVSDSDQFSRLTISCSGSGAEGLKVCCRDVPRSCGVWNASGCSVPWRPMPKFEHHVFVCLNERDKSAARPSCAHEHGKHEAVERRVLKDLVKEARPETPGA